MIHSREDILRDALAMIHEVHLCGTSRCGIPWRENCVWNSVGPFSGANNGFSHFLSCDFLCFLFGGVADCSLLLFYVLYFSLLNLMIFVLWAWKGGGWSFAGTLQSHWLFLNLLCTCWPARGTTVSLNLWDKSISRPEQSLHYFSLLRIDNSLKRISGSSLTMPVKSLYGQPFPWHRAPPARERSQG